jgi:hypothetical protein
MTRIMISLAASAAVLSLSTGAFACAQLDKSQSADINKNGSIILAQATGATGNAATGGGGPAVSEPAEQTGGKRKTETEAPGTMPSPNATDITGSTGAVDASQSKRKDTNEPPQSGAK